MIRCPRCRRPCEEADPGEPDVGLPAVLECPEHGAWFLPLWGSLVTQPVFLNDNPPTTADVTDAP